MLTTILPGLRDLRTPLATGYLWLTAMYLCVAELLPKSDSSSYVVTQIYGLSSSVGIPAMLGVLSFVAFLIGSVTTVENPSSKVLDGSNSLGNKLRVNVIDFVSRGNVEVNEQFNATVQRHLERAYAHTPSWGTLGNVAGAPDYLVRHLESNVSPARDKMLRLVAHVRETIDAEVTVIEKRMQNDKLALWDEYDRERAEASFRCSILCPLAIILTALNIRFAVAVGPSWWWLLVLVFVCVSAVALLQTYLRAFRHVVQADSMIKMAVVLDPTQSPIIAKVHRYSHDIDG